MQIRGQGYSHNCGLRGPTVKFQSQIRYDEGMCHPLVDLHYRFLVWHKLHISISDVSVEGALLHPRSFCFA